MTEQLHILSIEDSEDDEHLIRAELRRNGLGFDLVRVDNKEELRAALAQPWDVILSDYSMPSFNAAEALSIVRDAGLDIPFIIVSGSVGEEVAVQAMKAGAADYFRKENIRRLVPAIRREVAEKVLRDDRRRLEVALAETLENERALREEAERANRVKDDFLAVLSHELRTPLNAVLGRVHLLRKEALPADARKHALDVIERNARNQAQLVDDLLDVSRLAAGKMTLERKPVDVGAAVQQVIDEHRAAASSASIRLDVHVPAGLPPIIGEAARIRQIVGNLVSNAIKFSSAGDIVGVTATARGNTIELVVTDEGQGIAAEHLPRLFDRFFQQDQSTTRRHGGLGLGLAITRELVMLHGGSITAANRPSGGAEFRVTLPSTTAVAVPPPQQATPAPASRSSDRPLAGVRILVVDDDRDARELLCDLLTEYGATVQDAADGQNALRVVGDFAPSLILSDIGMPGMDGYQLLAELRRRGVSAPSIALTAYASADDRQRAHAAGFALHVTKPIKPIRLVEDIRRIAAA